MSRAASVVGSSSACLVACAGADTTSQDRIVEALEPLETPGELEPFLGRIETPGGHIDKRRVGPVPLVPARTPGGPQTPAVEVEFLTEGLAGASGKLGLLPPRAAARQEVAFGMPGQPADPRGVWIDVELESDGEQHFELPSPGPNWHADWAVVVLELERGRSRISARSGTRSEMLADGGRELGGRMVLGLVEVARRATRLGAVWLGEASGVRLDGVLDEAAWQRAGQALVQSRSGEPGDPIDAQLGGPTEVWFAWDATSLYVAGSLPDHDLYAPHLRRDDPLYRDEAFEVFLAADNSGRNYLEHQVSARDVVFDARFARYREGDESYDGAWRHAVALDGELERRGGDRGWTVELAFAWAQLCADSDISCPPAPGQELRVNVFRLDKPERKGQVALALSPTLEPDFHAWTNAAELILLGPEHAP